MGRHKKSLDRLKNYIRIKMIGNAYTAGMRLPSITSLGKKFDLKYNAARNALAELAAEGLLTHAHYAYIVNPWRRRENGLKLAVFMQYRLESDGIFHQALMGMLEEAFAQDMHFSFHLVEFPDITQEKLDAECANMDGAILLSSYDSTLPDLTLPVPGVGVMVQRNGKKRFSTVNINVPQTTQLAVGYFRKRHVSSVVIYSAPRKIFTDRGKAFADAFIRSGGEILHFRAGNNITDINIPEKAGIFCTSDFIANNLCSSYARFSGGVWLPEQRHFLSIDGNRLQQINDGSWGKFSTVACDWYRAGYLALQELQRLIASPEAEGQELEITGKIIRN